MYSAMFDSYELRTKFIENILPRGQWRNMWFRAIGED